MFINIFSPLKKGVEYMRRGEVNLAIEYFNALVSKKIKLTAAHFNLGRCYFKLGDYEKTKYHLHYALDHDFSNKLAAGILEITNWRLLSKHSFFNNWLSFSNDSQKIVFTSARKCSNNDNKINSMDCSGIYQIDLRTEKETCLVSENYYNYLPKFSPDDKYIAYFSVRPKSGEKYVLDIRANPGFYLLNLETGEETLLLDDSNKMKHFVFYPDSKRIIMSGWLKGGQRSSVCEINLQTKAVKIISGNYESTFPNLSANGGKLVFSSWRRDTNGDGIVDIRDNSGIYIKNLVTGAELPIAQDKYNNVFPSFSQDAQKVLFLSYRKDTNNDGVINSTDNPGVYMYNLDTQQEKCVVDDNCFNKFPSFVPDGRRIVFLSSWRCADRECTEKDYFENKGVYVADIKSGAIKNLVSDKYYGSYYPVVSPDGKNVAYVSWRKETNRGLYMASLNEYPDREELRVIINKNLA